MKKTLSLVRRKLLGCKTSNTDIYITNARVVELLRADINFEFAVLHLGHIFLCWHPARDYDERQKKYGREH